MIDRAGEEDRRRVTSRLRTGAWIALGLVLAVSTAFAASPAPDARGASPAGPAVSDAARGAGAAVAASASGVAHGADEVVVRPDVAALEAGVERVRRGWSELAAYYEAEVAPIERVLLRYRSDGELASRVAAALVREANAVEIEPRLLLGVLLVENPWLDPAIRSSVGAVGLMQVMPVHRGGWSCGSELEDIDTNVCLGARVFAHYFHQTGGDVEKALLRYNGCVTGSNTPNCHQYPSRVFAHAGRASVLAWLGQGPSAGSP